MTNWTKEDALKEIGFLIQEIEQVQSAGKHSAEHTKWILKTLTFLEEVFGGKSRYYLTFAHLKWSETGSFVIESLDIQNAIDSRHQQAFRRDLQIAKGTLQAAYEHLKNSEISDVYNGKDTGPESSAIVKIINLIEHKLRKVIRSVPSNEKEVQDALESLLIGADVAYSRETVSIEYSSKTYKPDFSVDKLDLAIEVKFCAKGDREKEMIGEINDDILAYQTKYGNLFFVVYDVGQIRDSDRFTGAFERHNNVIVSVVKH